MENDQDMEGTQDQGTQTTGMGGNHLLCLIFPNLVSTDQLSMNRVTQAFQGVGELVPITNGIYFIQTTQAVTSWAERVRQSAGGQFYVVPIDQAGFGLYAQYLPEQIRTKVQNLRAA